MIGETIIEGGYCADDTEGQRPVGPGNARRRDDAGRFGYGHARGVCASNESGCAGNSGWDGTRGIGGAVGADALGEESAAMIAPSGTGNQTRQVRYPGNTHRDVSLRCRSWPCRGKGGRGRCCRDLVSVRGALPHQLPHNRMPVGTCKVLWRECRCPAGARWRRHRAAVWHRKQGADKGSSSAPVPALISYRRGPRQARVAIGT